MVNAAVAKARELGVTENVAILDDGGNLKAFSRMDGAPVPTIEIAQNKAYTALFGVSTQDFFNFIQGDPSLLAGLAKDREVIIFNNAGVASSTGEVPTTFAGMANNAEAFIDGLGLRKVDLLGFSIGGMVAQQITLDRSELVRKLILVGTAPRNHA